MNDEQQNFLSPTKEMIFDSFLSVVFSCVLNEINVDLAIYFLFEFNVKIGKTRKGIIHETLSDIILNMATF